MNSQQVSFLTGFIHICQHKSQGFFKGFEFEWLCNATLTAEVISWRGRPDNAVAVGFDPKNSSSAGGALNHCITGPARPQRPSFKALWMINPFLKNPNLMLFCTVINTNKPHQINLSNCHLQCFSRPFYQNEVLSRPWIKQTKIQAHSRNSRPRRNPIYKTGRPLTNRTPSRAGRKLRDTSLYFNHDLG